MIVSLCLTVPQILGYAIAMKVVANSNVKDNRMSAVKGMKIVFGAQVLGAIWGIVAFVMMPKPKFEDEQTQ